MMKHTKRHIRQKPERTYTHAHGLRDRGREEGESSNHQICWKQSSHQFQVHQTCSSIYPSLNCQVLLLLFRIDRQYVRKQRKITRKIIQLFFQIYMHEVASRDFWNVQRTKKLREICVYNYISAKNFNMTAIYYKTLHRQTQFIYVFLQTMPLQKHLTSATTYGLPFTFLVKGQAGSLVFVLPEIQQEIILEN